MMVLAMWGVSLFPTSKDVAASRENCKEKVGECLLARGTVLGLPFRPERRRRPAPRLRVESRCCLTKPLRSEKTLSASVGSCNARFAPRDGEDNLFATEGGREVYVDCSG
jgi:hypothetical protein